MLIVCIFVSYFKTVRPSYDFYFNDNLREYCLNNEATEICTQTIFDKTDSVFESIDAHSNTSFSMQDLVENYEHAIEFPNTNSEQTSNAQNFENQTIETPTQNSNQFNAHNNLYFKILSDEVNNSHLENFPLEISQNTTTEQINDLENTADPSKYFFDDQVCLLASKTAEEPFYERNISDVEPALPVLDAKEVEEILNQHNVQNYADTSTKIVPDNIATPTTANVYSGLSLKLLSEDKKRIENFLLASDKVFNSIKQKIYLLLPKGLHYYTRILREVKGIKHTILMSHRIKNHLPVKFSEEIDGFCTKIIELTRYKCNTEFIAGKRRGELLFQNAKNELSFYKIHSLKKKYKIVFQGDNRIVLLLCCEYTKLKQYFYFFNEMIIIGSLISRTKRKLWLLIFLRILNKYLEENKNTLDSENYTIETFLEKMIVFVISKQYRTSSSLKHIDEDYETRLYPHCNKFHVKVLYIFIWDVWKEKKRYIKHPYADNLTNDLLTEHLLIISNITLYRHLILSNFMVIGEHIFDRYEKLLSYSDGDDRCHGCLFNQYIKLLTD